MTSFQALSTEIQSWETRLEEVNAKGKELADKGILDTAEAAAREEEDPRLRMNLDLNDVSEPPDTGVFPTPTSVLTTPGSPGDGVYKMAEREDSGLPMSPEGPAPIELLESSPQQESEPAQPTTEEKRAVSSNCFLRIHV